MDCEDAQRRSGDIAIAERFFAPTEVQALRAVPTAEQHDRFFDYWTLKEAYIKARGMGLAIPLGSFAFSLGPGGAVSIAIDPSQNDDPTSWQFMLLPWNRQLMIRAGDRNRTLRLPPGRGALYY